jgi:chromosome segregation ATPase
MAEVTNELMLEHLKAIQAKLSEHDRRFDELSTDLRSLKAHMAGFMSNEVNQDAVIAALRERIERIERRLEITG